MAVASGSQYYRGIHHTSYQSNGILNCPFQSLSSRSPSTFFHPIGHAMELTLTQVTVQGNQIEMHTLDEKPKRLKFQTVHYLFGQKI